MSELATQTPTAGWQTVELGEVLTLNYGKALPKAERNSSGRIPVYGANGIKDYADQALSDGPTLIIGRKGSAGQITRVDGLFWPLDVTYYTSHDQDRIDFDYLAYALYQLDLPSLARGVKPGINRNDVYALEVLLPPLDEQKRIVAMLDRASAALDRAGAEANHYLMNARELFDASLRQILEPVASAEPKCLLDEVAVTIVDCEHKTAPKSETGYPSVRTPNIGKGVLLLDDVNYVDESTYRAWTRRATPEAGDLIMAREAPAGNVGVIPEGKMVCLGQRTLLIKVDPHEVNSSYLAFLLLHPTLQNKLLAKSAGATVTHVNMKDIRALPIPALPGFAEQTRDAQRIRNIGKLAKVQRPQGWTSFAKSRISAKEC